MPYSIEITEVGPPEYPLIGVLHESVTGEQGFERRLGALLENKPDVLVLMAHLEGNPLGYAIGYGQRAGAFTMVAVGVLVQYAAEGVIERLRDRARDFARSRGYDRTAEPES